MPVRRLSSLIRPSRHRRSVVTAAAVAALTGGTLAGVLTATAAQEEAIPGAERVQSQAQAPASARSQDRAVQDPAVQDPAVQDPAEAGSTAPKPRATPGTARGARGDAPDTPAGPAARGTAPLSVMQFVSHPDDDLYFMNPDTAQSLADRTPLTTVYLTAGESNGVNARAGRAAAVTAPDKPAFAEARQNGIRAAYAEMATGDRTSPWDRTVIPTAGGGAAELDTLRARPEVRLVWLQLREAGSTSADRPVSLRGLWHGRIATLGSQLSSGTPVAADFAYSKEQVTATLTGLLDRFRPTFVRTLDPTPGTHAETGKLRDHQDHAYGARFVQAALARYAQQPGHPHVGVQSYMGYPNTDLPRALDSRTAEEKLRSLKTYAWLDGTDHCGSPAGCGDLKASGRPGGRGWTGTVRYARGSSTNWLQPAADGGLLAFGVQDGRLATWHRAPGGAWRGPELLDGGGLDGGVGSVRLPDGRIAVFGTRTTFEGPAGYRREVVTVEQTAPGGTWGPWRSLGTPGKRDEADRTPDISAPAVTVDGTGRVSLFLRDGDHRLAGRERTPGGTWGPWRALGGADLHGDPVAATDARGRVYVFAGTPRSVLMWTGASDGGPVAGPLPTGLPATTLALSAGPAPTGDAIRLWSRVPATGEPRAVDFAGATRLAPVAPPTGGIAGFGPVSAADGLLAARSRTGRLAVTSLQGGGAWRVSGFPLAGAPAAGPGGVAALGLDGRLHWTPGPAPSPTA
ncbi:PIG-L family deacetylase [Streptomyces sp. CC208A]|uniref:PIG-L family deacetylase n=1 Tax=Streptomyces sp. CC208A TaxID=3044573 RepID=UPI0024A7ECD0|nr:PIG-L family deacetylase [Streptomyces sp. CC208A]